MEFRVYIYICFLIFIHSYKGQSQLIINNTYTPQQLVQNFLVGSGVTVSNVTVNSNSDPRQFAHFSNSNSNLAIDSGIVMMTGYADDFANVGNTTNGFSSNNPASCGGICVPGDPDLNAVVTPFTTNDAAVIEFDFVPVSDTIRFKYTFASEEYPEYACGIYNDVFAFFLNGPGIAGTQNIATIPGSVPSLPVAINTINSGVAGNNAPNPHNCLAPNGSLAYSNFYVNNTVSTTLQFDGLTTVLEAIAVVIPCSTYHIKLAIADVGDSFFDSAVFFEMESFSSKDVLVQSITTHGDSVITEQCNAGQVHLIFSQPPIEDINLLMTISGTAINGIDYEFLTDSINVSAGDSIAVLDIIPITDNITEGLETIILAIEANTCHIDTVLFYINEKTPPPPPDSLNCGIIQDSIIAFTWDSVANVTGYQVSLDSGSTWITPNNGQFEHLFTGIQSSSNVGLWVRSIDSNLICTMPLFDSLTCSISSILLPVNCNNFIAKQLDNQVQLQWTISNASNNLGFSIERSKDGINFQEIAWVDGINTTNNIQYYSYTDVHVANGLNYYYRLKQVDNSNTYEYVCNIVHVQMRGKFINEIYLIPNPTRSNASLRFHAQSPTNVNVKIIDVLGRTLFKIENKRILQGHNSIEIPLEKLAAGLYYVELIDEKHGFRNLNQLIKH